jgi:hypothetical protein
MFLFVIDGKNLATYQECYIVETCKFFPYPEAFCEGKKMGKSCDKSLDLKREDGILLGFIRTGFGGGEVSLQINVEFNFLMEIPKPPEIKTLETLSGGHRKCRKHQEH